MAAVGTEAEIVRVRLDHDPGPPGTEGIRATKWKVDVTGATVFYAGPGDNSNIALFAIRADPDPASSEARRLTTALRALGIDVVVQQIRDQLGYVAVFSEALEAGRVVLEPIEELVMTPK